MIGAIIGDVIGSIYERGNIKTKEFQLFGPACHFTDDSVLTIALADSILNGWSYEEMMVRYFNKYPKAGYGKTFIQWARDDDRHPYNSYGNGAAMRISPAGWIYHNLDDTLRAARIYTEITHDHPEAIKAAQVVAGSIFMARQESTQAEIKAFAEEMGYAFPQTLDEIRPDYKFDVSCQGSVPQAILAFLESDSFEDCIRNAISIGGDSDTIACIAGSIAEPFYKDLGCDEKGIPLWDKTMCYLDSEMLAVVEQFKENYA